MNRKEYIIDHLFTFPNMGYLETDHTIWIKLQETIAPTDTARRVAFYGDQLKDVLKNCGNNLFTTWLVMFGGIDDRYLDKLWTCRHMYQEDQFRVWYWQVYKRWWYINDRLKECSADHKYKGIASALSTYVSNATDAMLIDLIVNKQKASTPMKWIGKKADAVRFAKFYNISIATINIAFGISCTESNLKKGYKDDYNEGIISILTKF